ENNRLRKLVNAPISRPWLQDFTAAYLGKGNYKVYGKKEIEDQIRALHTQGINEFLLWNGGNSYTPNVDYTPF
ncbi:MAG: putative glycoside hydrolase, partial [Bacillota bacterium]|nr:putative glycoside hydrolase [Bacillota bacterium]